VRIQFASLALPLPYPLPSLFSLPFLNAAHSLYLGGSSSPVPLNFFPPPLSLPFLPPAFSLSLLSIRYSLRFVSPLPTTTALIPSHQAVSGCYSRSGQCARVTRTIGSTLI
jgi:hypothetical protein